MEEKDKTREGREGTVEREMEKVDKDREGVGEQKGQMGGWVGGGEIGC